MSRSALGFLGALTLWCAFPIAAHADSSATTAASKAFSQGQTASLQGNHAKAAGMYELADQIVPSPEALRSAARAREKVGDLARAATHAVALQTRYPQDSESRKLSENMLDRLRPELTYLRVECTQPCTLSVEEGSLGGRPERRHRLFLRPGVYHLVATFEQGGSSGGEIRGEGGGKIQHRFEPPKVVPMKVESVQQGSTNAAASQQPLATRREPKSESGLSRGWIVVGGVLTTGLGAATVWSGMKTLDAKDRFKADPTQARWDAGTRSQMKTNILLGATAVVGVTTVLTAIYATRSSGPEAPSASPPIAVTGSATSAGLTLQGSF